MAFVFILCFRFSEHPAKDVISTEAIQHHREQRSGESPVFILPLPL
jgi:hypothetical protein